MIKTASSASPDEESDEYDVKPLQEACLRFSKTQQAEPDINKATERVREYAIQIFQSALSARVIVITMERDELNERAHHASERLKAIELQERNTLPYESVPEIRKTGSSNKIPFVQWDLNDRIVFVLSLTGLVCLLPAASFNVVASIMGQGMPVFLDNPWLAVGLSFLLPTGSLAIHSLGDLLPSGRARYRYMLSTLSVTAVVLLAWVTLFSENFPIAAGAMPFEILEQQSTASSAGPAFTFTQLAGEMLAGASLFLVVGHVLRKYTPEAVIRVPEMIQVAQEKATVRAVYEAVQKRLREVHALEKRMEACKQCFIMEQVALFLSLRRRWDDTNPLTQ
jgi:hypothetical protein